MRHRAAVPLPVAPAPTVAAKRSDWGTLKRLAPYIWQWRWRVLIALAFLVGAKLANVGVPLVLKELVDTLDLKPGDARSVLVVPVALLLAYGALRGWPREQTIRNFQQLTDTPELNASEVDRKSIMHYALPPWLFKGGDKSPCAVKPNIELSDGDKAFMQRVYPKATEPQVVASGPATSTTRSAKGTAARATQAKLVEEYRRSLQEAGLEQSKVDSLSKAFSASLSAK